MKNKLLAFLIIAAAAFAAACGTPAQRSESGSQPSPTKVVEEAAVDRISLHSTGRWAGTAFADPHPAFDANSDGVSGRIADMKIWDSVPFIAVEGWFDTRLVSLGVCAPGGLELQPFGQITFRGRFGAGLFLEVDPNGPHLCFVEAAPDEPVSVLVTGGTGVYQGVTGSGTLVFHDIVRRIFPTEIPDFPGIPLPAPIMIESSGTYSVDVIPH